MHSMKNIDGKEFNTAKGVNIANEFNEFKKILFNKKRIRQNANKRIKIKNALKKHLSGKKQLIRLFAKKILYNRNAGSTEPVKVLYEEKLVY